MAKKQIPEYACQKEAEIAIMQTNMKAVNHVVFGNGKDGLNISVPLLSKTVEGLKKGLEQDRVIRKEMGTTLSAMMRFQDEECLKASLKEDDYEKREKKRDRKLVIYMTVIAVLAIIVPTILSLVL